MVAVIVVLSLVFLYILLKEWVEFLDLISVKPISTIKSLGLTNHPICKENLEEPCSLNYNERIIKIGLRDLLVEECGEQDAEFVFHKNQAFYYDGMKEKYVTKSYYKSTGKCEPEHSTMHILCKILMFKYHMFNLSKADKLMVPFGILEHIDNVRYFAHIEGPMMKEAINCSTYLYSERAVEIKSKGRFGFQHTTLGFKGESKMEYSPGKYASTLADAIAHVMCGVAPKVYFFANSEIEPLELPELLELSHMVLVSNPQEKQLDIFLGRDSIASNLEFIKKNVRR